MSRFVHAVFFTLAFLALAGVAFAQRENRRNQNNADGGIAANQRNRCQLFPMSCGNPDPTMVQCLTRAQARRNGLLRCAGAPGFNMRTPLAQQQAMCVANLGASCTWNRGARACTFDASALQTCRSGGMNGMPMNGMQPNGMPMNGMQPNGMPMNGMQPNGMPMNGMQPNGMPMNGMPGANGQVMPGATGMPGMPATNGMSMTNGMPGMPGATTGTTPTGLNGMNLPPTPPGLNTPPTTPMMGSAGISTSPSTPMTGSTGSTSNDDCNSSDFMTRARCVFSRTVATRSQSDKRNLAVSMFSAHMSRRNVNLNAEQRTRLTTAVSSFSDEQLDRLLTVLFRVAATTREQVVEVFRMMIPSL